MINMQMLEHVPDFHKDKHFVVIKGLTRPLVRTPDTEQWEELYGCVSLTFTCKISLNKRLIDTSRDDSL